MAGLTSQWVMKVWVQRQLRPGVASAPGDLQVEKRESDVCLYVCVCVCVCDSETERDRERESALCILLYSGLSTYVGLYGSGLFNFGSYVNLL